MCRVCLCRDSCDELGELRDGHVPGPTALFRRAKARDLAAGDAVRPGAQRAFLAEGREAAPNSLADDREDLFGVAPIFEHTKQEAAELWAERAQDLARRRHLFTLGEQQAHSLAERAPAVVS